MTETLENIPINEPTACAEKATKVPSITSVHQFLMIAFFCTCGGPFGIESAVMAAGPMYTAIGCVIVVLLWCLPQALMAAELSMMMNSNGGCVIWVQTAFGNFMGFLNAHCNLLSQLISQSLMLQFVGNCIATKIYFGYWEKIALYLFLVMLLFNLNVLGIGWISHLSVLLSIFVYSPFVVEVIYMCIYDRDTINWSSLLVFPPNKDIHWGLLVSTIVWANGGFDVMGAIAGEVIDNRTFLIGLFGIFPVSVLNYAVPVLIGYLLYPQWQSWTPTMFQWIASNQFPHWGNAMGTLMVCAAVVAFYSCLVSVTAPLSRVIWAMAIGKKGPCEHRYLPYFLAWSIKNQSDEDVPVVAIFFSCLIPFLLSLFNLVYLFQTFLIIRLVTIYFEFAALIYFKYYYPELPRPFNLPGGVPFAVAMFLPILAISIFALIGSDASSLISGCVAVVVISSGYGVKLIWNAYIKSLIFATEVDG